MELLMEQDEAQLIETVCTGVIEHYARRGVSGIDADLISTHVCNAVYGELLEVRLKEIRAIVRTHIDAHNTMVLAKVLN
jgi:hypothetical protein